MPEKGSNSVKSRKEPIMAPKNKLGITDSAELARAEEKISKAKALELFEIGLLDTPDGDEVGTFAGLAKIYFKTAANGRSKRSLGLVCVT
jgi:hypothetical protein